MTSTDRLADQGAPGLGRALENPNPSSRLRAALAAGTHPEPGDVPVLIRRCGTEPDFFVRDRLTWALTRHPADTTVPLLLEALQPDSAPQARAQALHTLSKVGDDRARGPSHPRPSPPGSRMPTPRSPTVPRSSSAGAGRRTCRTRRSTRRNCADG
ncbi:HEAT repeat domain-containing protein [Leucobacter sp. CSA1]|uniref:HEAT repeat domain-containing protein n=1 Tax=Leucobacter chromiisoli TaxID=2796471 RepID=A0A934Q9V3_9MICO|nr:HEAT repeat domain-containing protein [Leucobacter chromiisoli]MBK0419836.1 HEAT repeat domain-containing protein [Leucobacter chromiisoli]